nr:hypothetical protein [uncultured Comamonas sp.]
MKIQLQIETHDRTLGFDLAAVSNTLKSGTVVVVPGGANLRYEGTLVRKAVGIPEVLQFIVDGSVNIDLALLATWLYEKVKSRPVERITVNRRIITEITEDRIRQVLEEEFRSHE